MFSNSTKYRVNLSLETLSSIQQILLNFSIENDSYGGIELDLKLFPSSSLSLFPEVRKKRREIRIHLKLERWI